MRNHCVTKRDYTAQNGGVLQIVLFAEEVRREDSRQIGRIHLILVAVLGHVRKQRQHPHQQFTRLLLEKRQHVVAFLYVISLPVSHSEVVALLDLISIDAIQNRHGEISVVRLDDIERVSQPLSRKPPHSLDHLECPARFGFYLRGRPDNRSAARLRRWSRKDGRFPPEHHIPITAPPLEVLPTQTASVSEQPKRLEQRSCNPAPLEEERNRRRTPSAEMSPIC